jgi:ATP-binding cassette, subfamily B, bacterial PglK
MLIPSGSGSFGQRQRIGIPRAFYHDPDILVLNEAISALETGTEYGMMQAVMAPHGKNGDYGSTSFYYG